MSVAPAFEDRDYDPHGDQHVHLHGVSWKDYERVLAIRGDRSAPRICYLDGDLEIMSPGADHENIKSLIGCLLEVWLVHQGIRFRTLGAWTLKKKGKRSGVEPDECYLVRDLSAPRPHLAIEVIWTHGGMDKLLIYERLGVGEVWTWDKGRLQVWVLQASGGYTESASSALLPGLDLASLAAFLGAESTYDAIVGYRAALEAPSPR